MESEHWRYIHVSQDRCHDACARLTGNSRHIKLSNGIESLKEISKDIILV